MSRLRWNGSNAAEREHLEALEKNPPVLKKSVARPKKNGKRKRHHYCTTCVVRLKRCKVCPKCRRETKSGTPQRVAQILSRMRRQFKEQPKRSYKDYLASEHWRVIRSRIMDRDGGKCRACSAAADQVHHMSYADTVMDGLDDSMLISLCRPCHDEIEFDDRNGVRIKNSLERANQKLAAKMKP